MKITKVGKNYVALCLHPNNDSFRTKAYLCPAGIWTIGFGTTQYANGKKVQPGDVITLENAKLEFEFHSNKIVAPTVDRLCRDDLNQNQFDAISDFVYNSGTGYRDKKGVNRLYNLFAHINNRMGKAELTSYWQKLAITGGGVVQPGLIKRRKDEAELFFKPVK